jgi:4-carboxymuconolactone decarboxylase
MARIPLIASRDALDADAQDVFDRIVESRGEVSRPFEVLLHAPDIAKKVSELGHVIRFDSHLSDADRELVTLATGRARGCAFVWESHLEAARKAGVEPDQIAMLDGDGSAVEGRQRLLTSFVDELCSDGAVSRETFDAVVELVGTAGVVEVIVTVGYYTMLSYAMSACEAC